MKQVQEKAAQQGKDEEKHLCAKNYSWKQRKAACMAVGSSGESCAAARAPPHCKADGVPEGASHAFSWQMQGRSCLGRQRESGDETTVASAATWTTYTGQTVV